MKERSVKTLTSRLYAFDLGTGFEKEARAVWGSHSIAATYAVRRWRPFARRRASTFRPFLVLIRLRKPCSRFLFRFDGRFNVTDIEASHRSRRSHYRKGAVQCQFACSHGTQAANTGAVWKDAWRFGLSADGHWAPSQIWQLRNNVIGTIFLR